MGEDAAFRPVITADAVLSIAPVCHDDVEEVLLVAVHPEDSVSVWTAEDPGVLLFRQQLFNVTCVATALGGPHQKSLVWFGGAPEVKCYRLGCRGGRNISMHLLYALPVEGVSCMHELHSDGRSLVAVVTRRSTRQALRWAGVENMVGASQAMKNEGITAECIPGRNSVFSASTTGEVTCALIARDILWLGCSGGAVLLCNLQAQADDAASTFTMRTAGSCGVTSLALLENPSCAPFVATGMQSGDVILWSLFGTAVLGHYFEHSGPVSAMAYVPWVRGFCTVSDTREVILWGLQESVPAVMAVLRRGTLVDEVGNDSTVRCLCPIECSKVVACAAKAFHILQWACIGSCSGIRAKKASPLGGPRRSGQAQQLSSGVEGTVKGDDRAVRCDGGQSEFHWDTADVRQSAKGCGCGEHLQKRESYRVEMSGSHLEPMLLERINLWKKFEGGMRPTGEGQCYSRAEGDATAYGGGSVKMLPVASVTEYNLDKVGLVCDSGEVVNPDLCRRGGPAYKDVESDDDEQTVLGTLSLIREEEERREFNGLHEQNETEKLASADDSFVPLERIAEATHPFFTARTAVGLGTLEDALPYGGVTACEGGLSYPRGVGDSYVCDTEVKALQLRLSLTEALLRSLVLHEPPSDDSSRASAIVLADVYLTIRNVLGPKLMSAVFLDMFFEEPVRADGFVIRKLLTTVCQRYRDLVTLPVYQRD